MPIIPNIATAKKYISVNYTNNNATLPPMRKAETELRKVLGTALFTTVQNDITANTVTELNELCQDYVCNYAYWLHLPDMMVQIGGAGLQVSTTENNPQPFKWQYKEKRAALAAKAMLALDDLLAHLLANNPTDWAKPEMYKGRSITSGAQFAQYYTLRNPEAVFLQLLPIIAEVERTVIHTAIGKEFYNGIIATNDVIVEGIRIIVAAYTINIAASRLSCQLGPDGFTVLLDPPDDPRTGQVSAGDQRLSAVARDASITGQTALHLLKETLNKTAASTGPYALYYASPLYTDPTKPKPNPNACYTGIFVM